MILTDSFWRGFELDLAEIKISYLNWSIGYGREPPQRYRHLFLWPGQVEFCAVNSRLGRAFAISPFGPGVRGVPRTATWPLRRGIDEFDRALLRRLHSGTLIIRESIREALHRKDYRLARQNLLNFYWLKLGVHELSFDGIQFNRSEDTGNLEKGRWGLDESEKWTTLAGLRNRVVNVVRYGEFLQTDYVKRLCLRLPGFSPGSRSTFLASGVSWNRYGLCAYDCGPVFWSRKGFVHFKQVKRRMKELGWPYEGSARQLLRPLYHIALDYTRSPVRLIYEPEEGYSLKSLRRRVCQLYEALDAISDEIDRLRDRIPVVP